MNGDTDDQRSDVPAPDRHPASPEPFRPTPGTAPEPDELADIHRELAIITGAVQRLSHGSWSTLSEQGLLSAASEIEAALRTGFGVQVRVAGEISARGVDGVYGAQFGARSTVRLLTETLRITPAEAKGRIAAAHACLPSRTLTGQRTDPDIPGLLTVIDDGAISSGHSKVITDCITKIPDPVDSETRALCHDVLLDEAVTRDPHSLRSVAEQIRLICDPDGSLSEKDPADRAELYFGRARHDGLTSIRGLLDPLTMEQLRVAVEDLARPQPIDSDIPDPRPAPLRRAQALGEVMQRYLTRPSRRAGTGHRPQIGVTIAATDLRATSGSTTAEGTDALARTTTAECTVGPDGTPGSDSVRTTTAGSGNTIASDASARTPALRRASAVGQFDYGMPVSLATARMLTCDGDLIPILLGADGAILDQGRAVRLFTREQRRALITRDKGCAFPQCDVPAEWCEAHHITYWSRGGPTDLANGVLLCRRHHTIIHREYWTIRPSATARGRPWFIPPRHLDPAQKPRQNCYFQLRPELSEVRRA